MKKSNRILWIVWTGEGDRGTRREVMATDTGIRRIVTKERCHGDRWAHAAPASTPHAGCAADAKDWWINCSDSPHVRAG
jgi:hypothetical protein